VKGKRKKRKKRKKKKETSSAREAGKKEKFLFIRRLLSGEKIKGEGGKEEGPLDARRCPSKGADKKRGEKEKEETPNFHWLSYRISLYEGRGRGREKKKEGGWVEITAGGEEFSFSAMKKEKKGRLLNEEGEEGGRRRLHRLVRAHTKKKGKGISSNGGEKRR